MDHVKISVYRVSLEVVRSVGLILKQSPSANRVNHDEILSSRTTVP